MLVRESVSPRAFISIALLLCSVTLSGCVTTLGYVPEYVKPIRNKDTLLPTYMEVKTWALNVLDGYDSRATINRQALYAGAVLAAASISAIAGLAAFGSNSSALIGIPVGTGFLGALAAVYQSDEKAAIYGSGSRYVKSLIMLSNKRITDFDSDVDGSIEVAASQEAQAAALQRLTEDRNQYAEQSKLADEGKKRADAAKASPTSTDAERNALDKAAKSLQDLADQAKETAATAEASVKMAETRTKNAHRRQRMQMEANGNNDKLSSLRNAFLAGEAICLQRDVNELMDKVANHIAVLDPKDLAARLKATKAPDKAAGGKADSGGAAAQGAGGVATQAPAIPPPDLSDLALPAKSSCTY
jgi:hypothetical protein